MKKRIVSVVVLFLILVLYLNLGRFIHQEISPDELTHTAIGETIFRINLYYKNKGELPVSLKELPRRNGYANSITDAWGNELIYTIESNNSIVLKSYGADGKEGGEGVSADIVEKFKLVKKGDSDLFHDRTLFTS